MDYNKPIIISNSNVPNLIRHNMEALLKNKVYKQMISMEL